MTFPLPYNARRRTGIDPSRECKKACNKLYYGDENVDDGPGETTMFRGVAVIGAVLAIPEPGGDPVISVSGAYCFDDREPRYALAIADQLRRMADQLEREAKS